MIVKGNNLNKPHNSVITYILCYVQYKIIMRQLTKYDILNLPNNINLYCIGSVNGVVKFAENKDLLITKRSGKYAKKYGEFALLSLLNTDFAEFSEYSIQNDGKLIDDAEV